MYEIIVYEGRSFWLRWNKNPYGLILYNNMYACAAIQM